MYMQEFNDFTEIFKHEDEFLKKWNHLNMLRAGDMPLWHYGHIDNLLKNIKDSKLNMGSLATMSDRHEGEFPAVVSKSIFWDKYPTPKTIHEHISTSSSLRNKLFISCWTARREEYEGFWRSFTDLKNGIAFKTNVEQLFKEITSANFASKLEILKLHHVKYVNFEKFANYKNWKDMNFVDQHGHGNACEATYHDGKLAFGHKYFAAQIKRHTFFHEREVRIIALNEAYTSSRIEFNFDWSKVIQEVYLSPHMDSATAVRVKKDLSGYLVCPIKESKVYEL